MDSQNDKQRYLTCPICDADVPIEPDTKLGQMYCCSYCKAPCKVIRGKGDLPFKLDAEGDD